jgi:cytochrome c biogenesis protein CcmG, thiol:disulfide interchange protein DsbE
MMHLKAPVVGVMLGLVAITGGAIAWDRYSPGAPAGVPSVASDSDGITTDPNAPAILPEAQQTRASDFSLQDAASGNTVTLSDTLRTEPAVFSFWATWCVGCNLEMPELNNLAKKYRGKVAFYGIDASDDPATIRKFARMNADNLTMLSDTGNKVSALYGVDSIPVLVIVGTDGKIKCEIDGFGLGESQYLPGILDQVIKESGG